MRSAVGTRENIKIIDSYERGGLSIEIMEYERLMGSTDTNMAQRLYFMSEQNMKLRQVAIYLNNDKVTVEKGTMSYYYGDLEMVSGVTLENMVGKFIKSRITGEKMSQPEYTGTGMLVLEPSFRHFLVLDLEPNESIIVDDGMFYCAQGTVRVTAEIQKNVSSALLGGETLFQQKLTGPGLVVLESPVPMCEVDKVELNNDTLKIDGNFAILRSANLWFTVERSAKTLVGSAVSGEGLVNVYRGTGHVWMAPTIGIYKALGKTERLGTKQSTTNINNNQTAGRTKIPTKIGDILNDL